MQTLATDPVVTDTITVTHVPGTPEVVQARAGDELRWTNHHADHHIVVLKGTCRVLDRQIQAGGSAFVPAGTDHSLKAGAWGCTFVSLDSVHQAI